MLQRYRGARMTLADPSLRPFGAMIYACHTWSDHAELEEFGVEEVSAAFDPSVQANCDSCSFFFLNKVVRLPVKWGKPVLLK